MASQEILMHVVAAECTLPAIVIAIRLAFRQLLRSEAARQHCQDTPRQSQLDLALASRV